MAKVCLYLQIHQPWRLKSISVLEIGSDVPYFETGTGNRMSNEDIIKKVAEKSYRPMMSLLIELLNQYPNFKLALSISGVALEQMGKYTPDVIESLKQMVETGRVELLAETYFHSLASLYSETEFEEQVKMHGRKIKELFDVVPRVFRNTELIYSNDIARKVREMDYRGMLAEGADKILRGRRPTVVYKAPCGLPLLLKHYQLSDDIAFRFSQTTRSDKPLLSETFSHWISSSYGDDEIVNLFMDFETFGEHQWEDTGIFGFFRHFVGEFLKNDNQFLTPTDAIWMHEIKDVFDSFDPVSWADVDRDITAWRGNQLQYDTLEGIYEMENRVINSGCVDLISDWRKLQTSDHFYYMCTKWSNDGDVHAYFSPYGSPYNAYINYNNALCDLKWRLTTMKNNG